MKEEDVAVTVCEEKAEEREVQVIQFQDLMRRAMDVVQAEHSPAAQASSTSPREAFLALADTHFDALVGCHLMFWNATLCVLPTKLYTQVRGITPFGKDHDGVEWGDIMQADWALYYQNNDEEEIRELRAWIEDKEHPERIRDVSNLVIDLFDRIASWDGRIEAGRKEEEKDGNEEKERLLEEEQIDDALIERGLQRVMLCDSLRGLSTIMEMLLEFDRDEQRKEQSAALAAERSSVAERCREELEEVNKELKDCKKKQM